MNFALLKIILWFKNGNVRELTFEKNKINIIRGGSHTGKTEILNIFDYCLFASSSKISESIVNENVYAYGIQFEINENTFTLARGALSEGKLSGSYFFSSNGQIPRRVNLSWKEKSIKSILEKEFSINRDVKMPFGGSFLKAGSKISLRYFLLFNTISGSLIQNENGVFFDKQHTGRYRDALPRIFNIAMGIETIENMLKKEQLQSWRLKEKEISDKIESIDNKYDEFNQEKREIIKKAKQYAIIPQELSFKDALTELEEILESFDSYTIEQKNGVEDIEKNILQLEQKKANLNRFHKEYKKYKEHLKKSSDSLKPIEILKNQNDSIIKTSIFEELLNSFEESLKEIKEASKNKTPIDRDVDVELNQINAELESLKAIYAPQIIKAEHPKEIYLFLGEFKAKSEIFSVNVDSPRAILQDQKQEIEIKLKNVDIEDTEQIKINIIRAIEVTANQLMEYLNDALGNYKDYKAVFNYSKKSLTLKKDVFSFDENVGSSSNHMFLHLLFSLSLHRVAQELNSKFIPSFLIIDQPSRPYWGDSKKRKKTNISDTDTYKLRKAFELLNHFMDDRIKNEKPFQMIVFEHADTDVFGSLEHIYLPEEFIDGNALVRKQDISQ